MTRSKLRRPNDKKLMVIVAVAATSVTVCAYLIHGDVLRAVTLGAVAGGFVTLLRWGDEIIESQRAKWNRIPSLFRLAILVFGYIIALPAIVAELAHTGYSAIGVAILGALAMALWIIFAIRERMAERAEGPEGIATTEVADAIFQLMNGPRMASSRWEDKYHSELKRIYKRTVPKHLRDMLVDSALIRRDIYGVSIDEGPVIALEGRLTADEAKTLAFDTASRLYFESGAVVKEINLHRRGRWTARWEHPHEWTGSVGLYELADADSASRSYRWIAPPLAPFN